MEENKLKKLFSMNLDMKIFYISHKNTAILSGFIAEWLIINGSVHLLESTLISIIKILYAFGILVPIAYYNMREYRKGYERVIIDW